MQEVNIFEAFAGIPVPAKEDKKAKKKDKAQKSTPADKAEIHQLPVAIDTCIGVITMPATDEKKVATSSEVVQYVSSLYPYFSASKIKKEAERVGLQMLNTGASKGSITINDETKMFFGSSEVDLSSVERGSSIDRADLIKVGIEQFPFLEKDSISCTLWSSSDNKKLCVIIDGEEVKEISLPQKDILVRLMNEEQLYIKKESYMQMLDEKRADGGEDSADVLLSAADVMKLIPEGYATGFVSKLIATAGQDEYIICPLQAQAASTNKTTYYNVEGKVISLLFRDYEVTSADFNGQVNVTESDIISFLVAKGHQEYQYLGVTIKEMPKINVIAVSPIGSKKGAFSEISEELRSRLHNLEIGTLSTLREGYRIFKAVRHPCFVAMVQSGGSIAYFEWTAPKIPYKLWEQGLQLSRAVCKCYETEVLLDLYYSETEKEYIWYVPMQIAGQAQVSTDFEAYLHSRKRSAMIKVGQFHSHGRLPAFFSCQDDCDEVIPGIYGVWGGMDEDESGQTHQFVMRALITYNLSIRLPIDYSFEAPANRSDHSKFIEGWWERISLIDTIKRDGYRRFRIAVGTREIDTLLCNHFGPARFYHMCQGLSVYRVVEDKIYLISSFESDDSSYYLILASADCVEIRDGAIISIIEELDMIGLSDFLFI